MKTLVGTTIHFFLSNRFLQITEFNFKSFLGRFSFIRFLDS